ncbi:MAG: peptidoglycan DD-metalloendopeptidase family protein [Bacteroidetes bacterium]|nr:peptidoglycan DD-metalloendopeptidase family protein [Bacteroidota bacterium]
MPKVKYYFNPSNLKYERVRITLKKRLLRVFGFLTTAIVFAAIIIVVLWNVVDSPKERQLKRQLEEISLQYEMLQQRTDQAEAVLSDIQDRDNTIYRVIFEADPIPQSVREAGYGGVDRYNDLKDYYNADLIREVTMQVDKLSKQLYIQSKSFDEVFNLVKNKSQMLASIPAIQPIANKDLKYIASGFGWRIHPIYKTEKMHSGMDFTAPVGTPIHATGNGTVAKIEYDGRGYGNNVIVNHGWGFESLYGHMSKIVVRPGQKITRGDLLGYVGSTGASTGPHLHYEVRKGGTPVNPANFYYNDLTPEEYEKMMELASRPGQSFD